VLARVWGKWASRDEVVPLVEEAKLRPEELLRVRDGTRDGHGIVGRRGDRVRDDVQGLQRRTGVPTLVRYQHEPGGNERELNQPDQVDPYGQAGAPAENAACEATHGR
jgi:hypothetical protein